MGRLLYVIFDDSNHPWWWRQYTPWNVGRQSFYVAVYPRRQLWITMCLFTTYSVLVHSVFLHIVCIIFGTFRAFIPVLHIFSWQTWKENCVPISFTGWYWKKSCCSARDICVCVCVCVCLCIYIYIYIYIYGPLVTLNNRLCLINDWNLSQCAHATDWVTVAKCDCVIKEKNAFSTWKAQNLRSGNNPGMKRSELA
jgi:hypothetical protein